MDQNIRKQLRNLPLSSLEKSLEFVSVIGLILGITLLSISWSALPESMPRHFNFAGSPDAWGGKNIELIFPIISLIIYAGITIMSRFPHIINYPYPLTAENSQRQALIGRSFLYWLKTEIIWIFLYIEWATIQVAAGKSQGLGLGFMPVFLIIIFGSIALYLRKAYKAK